MKRDSKGILLAIFAFFLYSLAILLIKITHSSHTLIVFSRSITGLLFLIFILYSQKIVFWRTQKIRLHFSRSIISLLSIYCSTYGIKHLVLVDAILLENTLPLFTTLITLVGFKKKIDKKRIGALLLGFIGVFFILKPKLDVFQYASLASLSVGFLTALSFVLVYKLSKTDKLFTTLFYFLLFSTLLSAIPLGFSNEHIPKSITILLLILIGVFFLTYQFLITKANSLASPNTICCFSYLTVAFTMLWEWLFWARPIDRLSLAGSILIIASGISILLPSRRRTFQKEIMQKEH